jgi:uncharacterized protein
MKDKQWAMASHLGALSVYIGIPLGHIIIPLVIWLSKKQESPLVEDQAKESLNFQLTVSIFGLIFLVFSLILIGIPFLIATGLLHIVFTIIATIAVDKGKSYRYPINFRFIK